MCSAGGIIESTQWRRWIMEPMIINFASTPAARQAMAVKMRGYFDWCEDLKRDPADDNNWNSFSEMMNNRWYITDEQVVIEIRNLYTRRPNIMEKYALTRDSREIATLLASSVSDIFLYGRRQDVAHGTFVLGCCVFRSSPASNRSRVFPLRHLVIRKYHSQACVGIV